MEFGRLACRLSAIVFGTFLASQSAHAATCGSGGAGFSGWLDQTKRQAIAAGVALSTVASALGGVTYDPKVIRLDRSQRSFKLSFEQFYARRVSSSLIARGRRYMTQHREMLDRMEKRFGVPAGVVIAIWGLETNYGSRQGGNLSIFRSLATLAYDCRRSAFFMNELHERDAHRRPGRHAGEPDARRLGGRDRADAVPAVVLLQVRRRFRRQRPPRLDPQCPGHPGLD